MDLRSDMSIGDRVKVARRYRGLSQEQLAEQAGINVDTVRKDLALFGLERARVAAANPTTRCCRR